VPSGQHDGGLSAGGGRLARVIATRGGTASPEAPFRIEHREALIYMLCEAAELEHGIMCQYLFAAFSLKQRADEGLSDGELRAVQRWRTVISHIATQEMLHLVLVHNLLSAIGAAPHLARPNLPHPADHYPEAVHLALLPFGKEALQHFMYLERPEGMDLDDAEGLVAVGHAMPHMVDADIVPRAQDFSTIGHLYRSIEQGIAHLADMHGERWLFVGPPRAQATQAQFRWPELVAVTDLASAQQAIDTILEQGEGPRGEWRNAHFGQFVDILDEYEQMCDANPDFDPVRPVMPANVRPHERGLDVPLITNTFTAGCADLFNVGYEILLQILERYFAHTTETDAQLATLADVTVSLMFRVIKPLGELITTLPVSEASEAKTAGPSFELFYETDYLMPHREAAWALLSERLDEAAAFCERIRSQCGERVGGQLAPIAAALSEFATSLGAQVTGGWTNGQASAAPQATMDDDTRTGLRQRTDDLARRAGLLTDRDDPGEIGAIFGGAHRLATRALEDPADEEVGHATTVARRLIESVLRPLADILSRSPTPADSPQVTLDHQVDTTRLFQDELWDLTKEATARRTRLASGAPPELIEAIAALQDLACRLASDDALASRLAELRVAQAGLGSAIQPAHNGPYLVTNPEQLTDWLGQVLPTRPQMALCRCGQSGIKPLCDGSHAAIAFTDAKDPSRVPDRRDTYKGVAVTILDNRGTCQHSGLCSDRLATVFRVDEEPFVAPNGGRMDEIIRAVRSCPSGALSFALDGREAVDHVDWGRTRESVIEVTKDGPYRITGGIPLIDDHDQDVERNHGASYEHYALCRCGHSQNKPFCSGMHWYVDFRDPLPDPEREPTLFEWCGGLPALRRLTRIFYEKHVPEDPLLAPLFAEMSPDHPERVAAWLGETFGGPKLHTERYGGYDRMVSQHMGKGLSEEQRARWASLMIQSADEARLPTDPEFRAAFVSYIEWGTRIAVENSTPGAKPPQHMPVPRWWWVCDATPGARVSALAAEPDDGDEEPARLPGPDEEVSFTSHIKTLFRAKDRTSMRFAFDLWTHGDVSQHADAILARLKAGTMPCDGAWPAEKTEAFERWMVAGKPA
jgi:CDGSH-type Zn-finger protein/truncated hemoglobin YjbI/ferredoxin